MLGLVLSKTKEFTMDRIAQEKSFRQAVFKYAEIYGVTKATVKYHVNRQFIYRMRWRYDGTAESLMPKSRRPHSHPNQHTDEEIALIKKMRAKFINDDYVVKAALVQCLLSLE